MRGWAQSETVLLLDSEGRMDISDIDTGRLRTPIRPPGDLKIETPWVEPLFGFSPHGLRVYVAQSNGKIEIYNAGSGRPAGSLVLPWAMAPGRMICTLHQRARRRGIFRRTRRRCADRPPRRPHLESPTYPREPATRRSCEDGKSVFLPVTTYTALPRGRLELCGSNYRRK